MHTGLSIILYLSNPLQQMNDITELMAEQRLDSDIETELLLVARHWEQNTCKAILANCFLPRVEIRFITEFRSSQAFARESGIRSARYELICLLRTDSPIPEDALQKGYSVMAQDLKLGAYATKLQLNNEPFRLTPVCVSSPGERTDTQFDDSDVSILNIILIRKAAWFEIYENGFFLHLAHIDHSILEDRELCSGIKLCGWKVRFDTQLLTQQSAEYQRLYKKYLKCYHLEGKADPILECYHFHKSALEYSEIWWEKFSLMSRHLFLAVRSLIKIKNFNPMTWFIFRRRLTALITLCKLYPSYTWHSHQIRLFMLRARASDMRKESSKTIFDPYLPLQT